MRHLDYAQQGVYGQQSLYTADSRIDKTFWPDSMQNLTSCMTSNDDPTAAGDPRKIMFIIIVSKDAVPGYMAQIKAMRLYCRLHQYTLHLVDPLPILRDGRPAIQNYTEDKQRSYTTALRPIVMRETFQRIYQKNGCKFEWVIFLDADIFIVDFQRKLEVMIRLMDDKYARPHSGLTESSAWRQHANISPDHSARRRCKIIAQDSDQAINGGFLMFSMTDTSYNLLTYWPVLMKRYSGMYEWLYDQGYLQRMYLEYAQVVLGKRLPFDCAAPRHTFHEPGFSMGHLRKLSDEVTSMYGTKGPICSLFKYQDKCQTYIYQNRMNGLRNICYSKALEFLGLSPGGTVANPSRSVGEFCLAPGTSTFDRFNNREVGEYVWDEEQWTLFWNLPNSTAPPIMEPTFCSVSNVFFYHGKEPPIVAGLTHSYKCALAHYQHLDSTSSPLASGGHLNITRVNCSMFQLPSQYRQSSGYSRQREQECVSHIWLPYNETIYTL